MYCIHWNSPKDLWQLRINQHEISYVFCINNAMSWFLSGKIECFTTSPPIWSCSRWFLLTRTPAMLSTGSFKKQPRRSADWKKNKTQVFLVYFGQRGVCNKKWDEVWRRACIYVGRIQNVVWFVDWRCWRNVRDSFENDLIYNIWSFKMPRLLEFLSPWQALVEAKTSKKVYTHMCERTTPWKHGVPQRFSGTPGVVEDEG